MAAMQQQPDTTANSAAGLIHSPPDITPSSPWSVTGLEVLPGYRLKVKFIDGLSGIVDMAALVHSEQAGVFARLQDSTQFAKAFIAYGAVSWPPGIAGTAGGGDPALDLAPDAMRQAISQQGEWRL
jgi:hypothetical protein